MSLTLALNSALSGLSINQRSLQVLSQNISNANTVGYSRESIQQAAVYLNGQGAGVTIDSITRKANDLLQQTVRDKTSDLGRSGVLNDYLNQAQILYGQPGSTGSIDQGTQTFFNSLQSLSISPESSGAQQSAISSGVTLAQQISSLAGGLETLRFQADQAINTSITTVNQQITSLYKLNAVLASASARGEPTAGLLDQRDTSLKAIAEQINISVTYRPNGEVRVYATNGVPLVDDQPHALQYAGASSVTSLVNNIPLSALQVATLDKDGHTMGTPLSLVQAGYSGNVNNPITSGILSGLIDLRDAILPTALDGLDNFASVLRDQLNTIQNAGSGIPGVSQMTGTRMVSPSDTNTWTGDVRIAVLGINGQPVPSPYGDESGLRPFTLDLGALDGGEGQGKPTVQSIINAINSQFGAPQSKAELGNLNNITLVSQSTALPGASQTLKFDLGLDNISANNASLWVTGATVTDSSGAVLSGAITSNIPQFTLSPSGTYTPISGTRDVVVKTLTPPTTLNNGDVVYLGGPGTTVNGLAANDLTGYFVVSNVTSAGFTVTASGSAVASASTPVDAVGTVTGFTKYGSAEAGEATRTTQSGSFTANFSGNPFSPYYDITLQTGVDDGSGAPATGSITYRVYNNTSNLLNQSYSANSAGGAASVVLPTTNNNGYLSASLVDASGREIPKNADGAYVSQSGYLQLKTLQGNTTVAIDELNSQESGTGWGFSHYFDLNDFFKSNAPSATGDTVKGSAFNLAVNSTLTRNPGALSTGKLSLSTQPSSGTPVYTYQRSSGDNSIVQRMAALSTGSVDFVAAGGLSAQSTSLSTYAATVLSASATAANQADDDNSNNQALLAGFQERLTSLTGVNLDEELANTIIYQNSYSASARIITVVNQMLQDLIGVFQ